MRPVLTSLVCADGIEGQDESILSESARLLMPAQLTISGDRRLSQTRNLYLARLSSR
ncbi:MAG: hypothetical protein WBA24_11570 [Geitlerinemataceae cyanobacterium]